MNRPDSLGRPDPFGDAFTSHLARRLASDCKRAVDIAADAHPRLVIQTIWHEAAGAGTVIVTNDDKREQVNFKPGVSRRDVISRVRELADRMGVRRTPGRDIDTSSETALMELPFGKHQGRPIWRIVQMDFAYATWAATSMENEIGKAFARYLAAMDPRVST